MKYPPSSHDIDSGSKQQPRSKSPRATEATSVLKPSSVPELSIFPAFTPDPIRLAELKGSSTYSPPVSPTRGDAREIFAAIDKDQTFFNMLEARGLTLEPTAESSDVDKVSDRIDAVRCVDGRRRTLLHQACRCGNVQAAKCLLFHEANASARCRGGRTPFHEAVSSATGKTALELLKLLFEHDPAGISIVDANGSHVLHLAAIHGNLDVIKWCAGLITQSSGKRSVKSPSPISRYLMDLDITSFSGRNMLHYATYNGRLDVIKWLLGEDNLRRGELSWVALDVNGYSVLHYAAMGAPLEVCEWLVLKAPGRHELNLTARTSEGKTAMELASARPSSIRHFLADISKVPCVPSELRCVGADTTSLGVGWDIEPASSDTRLWETLKPMYFHLEICKKPASLSRASGFLTMLMLMPSTSPGSPRAPRAVSSALMSASSLLYWKPLGVLLQPEAREHWLCNLERDTEYLVRMRARNRNGFSGYTVPNLSGVFTTSDGGRRRSLSSLQRFFGAIKKDPPVEAIVLSFIGDLHFELLEARGLPHASHLAIPTSPNLTNTTPQERYYAVVTIETPSTPDVECSGNSYNDTRLIYCVRSPLATLQQDLVLSGSSQVWRHPRFSLCSVFRAPESLAHTKVTITVDYERQGQNDSCCVGKLSLSLLDLVQGMPAKMQWLPLLNVRDTETNVGLVLLRTLFLPNGVSELPHPTLPNTWGTTAEELLGTPQELSSEKGDESGSPPGSSSSTASTSSSSSSLFSHPSMLLDRLGFGVFDPEMQLRNGEWQRNKLVSGVTRSYAYYKLLVEALEQQQEKRWHCLRCSIHANQASQTCNLTGICGAVSDSCNDNTVASEFGSCVFDGPQKHAVRELVWQGIPMSRRPEVYSQMSGALITKTRYPVDYFLSLIKRLKDPTDEVHSRAKSSRFSVSKKQIQVDLKRTFAGNDECWLASSMGQKSLERVLLAYALHNDALGYCQSMTFIVGRLLCLYHSQMLMESSDPIEVQERVFWLLHVLCEDFFPSYYTQGMTGLQVDGGVLEKLIRTRLPKLHRHFQRLHVPPMGLVLVTQWLLPLCCAVFPSETTFRFLDVLFFEGSSVVFAMAIALLRISQHKLLAENVDCTQLFRFLRARDQRLHDAPLLMEVANEEHQLLSAQVGPLRESVAQELGIDKGDNAFKSVKLSSLPVDELRPGDVDIHI
ncbi:hypothetical protein PC129_g14904 [Phytophthora cactorum]|uniref:Rab-GAP TBC domain-containing protein n=1 Tax=Phytophthora cactorum TaxID=29920 RepID=A0A329RQ55_9STRA|nr:hypothetical protein Pcac1_g20420 [Phytophthora cactorum]KAG2885632.1 hypothetical protein PC114_g19607 [Phytophthora cactorum]KAG2896662.1 hypothetical protein PC115_g17453 [Phytophthora cactorum]KAG2911534.1 hypothetical protein PC117_g19146 [Phytophthora cactorum]KAG2990540.1 hypothetical protein PC119_g19081 [Phytophthora cactorum]